ncbi:MAG: hypothetical protein ACO1O1_16935 [Adhaeribacter sp.]
MKINLRLITFVLIVLSANTAKAKIWRVNNNTGFSADFTTLQAAHNGAAAGDTLYLESSANTYGNLNCTKKLVIIGPGYYHVENGISGINTVTAKVSSVYMQNGSQGSEIIGLDFEGASLSLNASDIVVKRNKFHSSQAGGTTPGLIFYSPGTIYLGDGTVNNIFIIQNIGCSIQGASYANAGLLISNNLIISPGYSGETNSTVSLNLHANTVAIVQHNIFLRGTVSAYTSSFTNNIMVNGYFEKRENMTAHNLAGGSQFGTGDGNQANVDMNAVFVGSGSPDARWMLKAGSPAMGAGYGHTAERPVDAGMYSGNTPYKLSGLPGIPVIYFINVQAVGSDSDPIDVTVKVKSTN